MRRSCRWRLEDVLKATGGILLKKGKFPYFSGISTDSRVLEKGDLFIALKGTRYDGHEFVPLVIEKGAFGIIIERHIEIPHFDGAVIKVKSTIEALGKLAKHYRMKYKIPFIAITGSNGKTTTKEMTAHILGLYKKVLKNKGNYNNYIGVPFTIFSMDAQHEIGIVEMATNRPGEIDFLANIVMPEIGVITAIHPVHLMGLRDIEGVKREKGSLLKYVSKFVFNADDDRVVSLSRGFLGERIGFGIKNGDVRATAIDKNGLSGITFKICLPGEKFTVKCHILGGHQVYNALAAATVAWVLGTPSSLIKKGLETFTPLKGRLSVFKGKNGIWILDDSYNANPKSVLSALEVLRDLPGKKIVVLGDMLELGDTSKRWHEEVGRAVASILPKYFVVFGQYKESLIKGALEGGLSSKEVLKACSHGHILSLLNEIAEKNDILLIKASHALGFEGLVDALTEGR